MSNETPDLNPYASPAIPDGLVQPPIVSTYEMLKDLKQFRAEIHALGAYWTVIGVFAIGVGIVVAGVIAEGSIQMFLFGFGMFAVAGTPFLIAGIFTCCKQTWAVYVGLSFCYLFGICSIIIRNPCLGMIFLAGIFGGHRIMSWAQELRRKEIPLTTRPRDIKTPIQLPPLP